MSTATTSVLNMILNRLHIVLSVALLFAANSISYADDISTTNNMPVPGNQGAPVQEMLVEKTPDQKESAERPPGKVARAIFTSKIIDREPADNLAEIINTSERIYFFTDLRNLKGQIVTHRWEYKDKVMAEVKFKVGEGPRWRVYSSKNLLPEWTGVWTVIVSDENEQTLNASAFNYTQATKADEAPTEQEQQAAE